VTTVDQVLDDRRYWIRDLFILKVNAEGYDPAVRFWDGWRTEGINAMKEDTSCE
jgi:hypothetical protein